MREGTLRELPGIGASTAEVIEAAVEGRTPDRLAEARAGDRWSTRPGREELRGQLRGDLHSHSDWSDGGSPIEEMAFTAIELGHDYLVLTDHSPRLTVANGLSVARLTRQLGVVEAINEHLGSGPARSACSRASRSTSSTTARSTRPRRCSARLDLRVASVHSKLAMDKAPMTKRMVNAVHNPFVNVLGHCTGRLVTGNRGMRRQSEFDAEEVFGACLETGTAVEINSRPERRDPPTKLLQQAIEMGCLFSIDSDAHAPGQLDFLSYGCARAEELGLEPDRIVNTWPARPAAGVGPAVT